MASFSFLKPSSCSLFKEIFFSVKYDVISFILTLKVSCFVSPSASTTDSAAAASAAAFAASAFAASASAAAFASASAFAFAASFLLCFIS